MPARDMEKLLSTALSSKYCGRLCRKPAGTHVTENGPAVTVTATVPFQAHNSPARVVLGPGPDVTGSPCRPVSVLFFRVGWPGGVIMMTK